MDTVAKSNIYSKALDFKSTLVKQLLDRIEAQARVICRQQGESCVEIKHIALASVGLGYWDLIPETIISELLFTTELPQWAHGLGCSDLLISPSQEDSQRVELLCNKLNTRFQDPNLPNVPLFATHEIAMLARGTLEHLVRGIEGKIRSARELSEKEH